MKKEMKLTGLIIAAGLVATPFAARAQDERTATQIDTTVALDRGGSVDLSLISGRIRVTGWDRSDVKISATIESGYLRFSSNSSRVTLSVDDEGGGRHHNRNNNGDARYEVSVPRGAKLILEAVSGDVSAKGSQGEIEASSVSGDATSAPGIGRSSSVRRDMGSAFLVAVRRLVTTGVTVGAPPSAPRGAARGPNWVRSGDDTP
jgi:hypothetical protein